MGFIWHNLSGAAGTQRSSGLGDFWIVADVCLSIWRRCTKAGRRCRQRVAEHTGRGIGAVVLWLRRTVLSAFYPAYMVWIELDAIRKLGL